MDKFVAAFCWFGACMNLYFVPTHWQYLGWKGVAFLVMSIVLAIAMTVKALDEPARAPGKATP